ncbi:MAG: IS5 family transposase [Acidimicrobiia bacterium]
MDLTDEQWSILEPLIPRHRRRADQRGRPWCDDRQVLNGILWVLRTGAQWRDVPDRYPSPATCHRRFQYWVRAGVFVRILAVLAEDLRDRGRLDLSEGLIDGSFVIAKKGGSASGHSHRGKGSKLMAVADRSGLPIAVDVAGAARHDVTLVDTTLEARFLEEQPEHLIGDKAFDSDELAEHLAARGIELIAPHRARRRIPRQDGRSLRRYRRRWRVERLFAWLQNFRRLVVRYERDVLNFLGFVHLGCIVILLRQYL